MTWRLCVPEQLRNAIDQSNGGAGGAGEDKYVLCALTNVDLRKMTVASLTKRLVESPDINAQQIESMLKNRYNVLSKNTTKELVAHEYARTVCGVVALLVDGGVGILRVDPPEEMGGGGDGSHGAGVTGGGEEDVEEEEAFMEVPCKRSIPRPRLADESKVYKTTGKASEILKLISDGKRLLDGASAISAQQEHCPQPCMGESMGLVEHIKALERELRLANVSCKVQQGALFSCKMQLKSAGRLCEELRLKNRDQFLALQNVLRPLEHEVSLADAACKKQEERVRGLTEELRFLSPKNAALKKWGATLLTELSTGSKQSGAKSQKKGK